MGNIGLYYYKLVSPYSEDQTLNCKLSINQIDHNFKTLKDADIKSAELDEETKSVILTRNDGEKFVVDLTPILSGAVYDLEVSYDDTSSGANLNVSYNILGDDDKKHFIEVPISGLITTDNIDTIYGEKVLTRVYTDGTLNGNGTSKSPLSVSKLWLDTPAIKVIDKIEGEELPLDPSRGDKYVTREKVNEYGVLYNYNAVESISGKLASDGSFWRIPSKEDWDCLLNSLEPCECAEDISGCSHSNLACHTMLGEYAGKKLKSKCGWFDTETEEIIECECLDTKPLAGHFCDDEESGTTSGDTSDEEDQIVHGECYGIDEIGMRVLPSGYMREYDDEPKQIGKTTSFWTSSYVCGDKTQDIYIKKFDYDKCGVVQEAQCIDDLYSLRLVKDYDGENHLESEVIDGFTYKTVLIPECKQIWTSSNFMSEYNDEGARSVRVSNENFDKIIYFVNVWNGKIWEKRPLSEGETIVVIEGNEHCQYNIEYSVYLESGEHGCNNQVLKNTDDAIVERIYEKYIVPLSGAIDTEREERIEADEALSGAIESEIERAISAETALDEKIEQEIADRIADVDEEEARAISAETALDEKIEQEIADRIADVDEEEARAISAETILDGQLIDWGENYNPYVMSVNSNSEDNPNLILRSKDGIKDHFINIKLISDFGTF